MLWIGLSLFACAWMFVLGVLVGRGTAPVQFDIDKLQKELAALKEAVVKKERLRFKINSEPVRQRTDMGFYEDLKNTQENSRNSDMQLGVAIKKDRQPLSNKTDTSGKEKRLPVKIAPAESSERQRLTTKTSERDTEQRLTIQIASLRDIKIADRMVARLKDKWYPAYRTVVEIPGKGTWYRVRIGSFKRKAEAAEMLERLKKDNFNAVLLPQ